MQAPRLRGDTEAEQALVPDDMTLVGDWADGPTSYELYVDMTTGAGHLVGVRRGQTHRIADIGYATGVLHTVTWLAAAVDWTGETKTIVKDRVRSLLAERFARS